VQELVQIYTNTDYCLVAFCTRILTTTGDCENHINGDIAIALQQLWVVTGDKEWLRQTAWPMVQGIADFWASKAKRITTSALSSHASSSRSSSHASYRYEIHNVMPPDEYHKLVNNSAYTNSVAKIALNFAIEVATVLGHTNTSANVSKWVDVASHLFIPLADLPAGMGEGVGAPEYHPEYDGYTLGTTIKQGDVILMGFPLQVNQNMTHCTIPFATALHHNSRHHSLHLRLSSVLASPPLVCIGLSASRL
jgi:hypothetical protein